MHNRLATCVVCATSLSLGCAEVGPDPRILTGPLLVDSEFDADQRAAIEEAVNLWTEATDGRFAPTLQFVPVQCEEPFAIEAVHVTGCFIGQKLATARGEGTARVLGATDPESHWISLGAWLEGSRFRETVAHELGHYLLLGHGEGIMAQARQRRSVDVTEASISEFCELWGC